MWAGFSFVCYWKVDTFRYIKFHSKTEPCGTPDVTSVMSDRAPLTETICLRLDRKI